MTTLEKKPIFPSTQPLVPIAALFVVLTGCAQNSNPNVNLTFCEQFPYNKDMYVCHINAFPQQIGYDSQGKPTAYSVIPDQGHTYLVQGDMARRLRENSIFANGFTTCLFWSRDNELSPLSLAIGSVNTNHGSCSFGLKSN